MTSFDKFFLDWSKVQRSKLRQLCSFELFVNLRRIRGYEEHARVRAYTSSSTTCPPIGGTHRKNIIEVALCFRFTLRPLWQCTSVLCSHYFWGLIFFECKGMLTLTKKRLAKYWNCHSPDPNRVRAHELFAKYQTYERRRIKKSELWVRKSRRKWIRTATAVWYMFYDCSRKH